MLFPPDDIERLVTKIAAILRSRKENLAISEAACGGLLSAYIVTVPGASNFYIGGKLVYSLRQRLKLSGCTDEEISSYVGPSEQVALRLARTAKYELGSTYVLSETGFAGPSKDLHLLDSDSKSTATASDAEVGTVYLGLCGPTGEVSCMRNTGSKVRASNMVEFARLGLQFLLDQLERIESTES